MSAVGVSRRGDAGSGCSTIFVGAMRSIRKAAHGEEGQKRMRWGIEGGERDNSGPEEMARHGKPLYWTKRQHAQGACKNACLTARLSRLHLSHQS
jgi:hypothetical protein